MAFSLFVIKELLHSVVAFVASKSEIRWDKRERRLKPLQLAVTDWFPAAIENVILQKVNVVKNHWKHSSPCFHALKLTETWHGKNLSSCMFDCLPFWFGRCYETKLRPFVIFIGGKFHFVYPISSNKFWFVHCNWNLIFMNY